MHQKDIHTSWQRIYRTHYTNRHGETSFQVVVEESDIHVIAEHNLASPMLETLRGLRADIKAWQLLNPDFRSSLMPLPIPNNAPQVIKHMYEGASKAGVGPFAAVAGTIAHLLAQSYIDQSPNIIVENGGDIYLYSKYSRVVALLTDPKGGPSLGLKLTKEDFPLALCASSATIGHSLSLGCGELAVVRSKNGALADAVATALGNRLKNSSSIEPAIEFAQGISGIDGVFIQCDDNIGIWGNMTLTQV